ncbi:hypothetical protein [Mailhella sp.]
MSDISKERQLSLVEEEKPVEETAAPRTEKPRKPCGDRSSKFCYQPGELRIVRADRSSKESDEPDFDRSDKFVSQPGEMRLIKKNTK